MDLSKILSITGKSGLFKLISQGKNNFIVESLVDGKRCPAFSHDGVANLDNISIFTVEEDVSLHSVFQSIYKKENGGKVTISMNDNAKLKSYFEEILPNYDKDRVYVSNIKKVYSWYNLLIDNNLIDLEDKKEESEAKTEDTDKDAVEA